MSKVDMSRRLVLAGVGATSLIAFSGIVVAANELPYDLQNPPTWENVTDVEMRAFMRNRFWMQGDDGFSSGMRLVRVQANVPDPHRPAGLPRKAGFVALFVSSRMDHFIDNGAQVVAVGHEVLGNTRLFVSAVQRRNGRYLLEIVLN